MWRDTRLKASRQFKWLKLWVKEGYSVRELASMSGRSPSTITRILRYWLQRPPPNQTDLSKAKYLIFDGTWLQPNNEIYVVMNAADHSVIAGAYDLCERSLKLTAFYAQLASRGLTPRSATTDGEYRQLKYIQAAWPGIVLQRCLVHVQRQGLCWCRRYPKTPEAKGLRKLFLALSEVKSQSARTRFIRQVHAWEKQFGPGMVENLNRGRVFTDLLLARRTLLKALPHLFPFLKARRIPNSTNALEGYFARLKEKYRRHRGMAPKNRHAFFQWYFCLQPK